MEPFKDTRHQVRVEALAALVPGADPVPVTITVMFPKGHGLTAVAALRRTAADPGMFWHELLKAGDEQTVNAAREALARLRPPPPENDPDNPHPEPPC